MAEQITGCAPVSRGRRLWRIGLLLLLVNVVAASVVVGFEMRRWAWEYTMLIRHHYDINRNFDFGRQCMAEGYLDIYENMYERNVTTGNFSLNYPPLRLMTFYMWARWADWKFPGVTQWREDHAFNAFTMYFNTMLELLGAVAAYLLVRHWICRTGPPREIHEGSLQKVISGGWRPTVAFLLVWFNPAMILSAHGWPSWDIWVIPFFLWAVLLACWEWWFVAGLVMGLAGMFKGQQMFIAVVFLLWPLFAGQIGRALRWLAGFGLAAALVVSPWMLSYRTDFGAPARIFDWRAFAAVMGCMVVAAVGTALIKRLTWRTRGYIVAGVLAASLLLCIPFGHASMAWWKLGFMYGTERHPDMVVGPGNNLGALMDARFGFHNPKEIAWTIPAKAVLGWPGEDTDVELRYILFGIFLVLLVLSCIAIARQWRRQDRRFLIAILTPWMLFYSIPLQIHDRYLLFVAVPSAILIGLGVGPAIMGVFLTFLTFLQTAESAMGSNPMLMGAYYHPLFNPDFITLCRRLRPDISWAVLAIAGVYFFSSFTTSRWRRQMREKPRKVAKPAGANPRPSLG